MCRMHHAAIVLACLTVVAHAQGIDNSPDVRIVGGAGVSADYYGISASMDSAGLKRRPPELYRIRFTPTILVGNSVAIPISVIFTPSAETNMFTPRVASPSLWQIATNPLNVFACGIQTTWVSVSLGTHTPSYSALTGGDRQMFGAGVFLHPWRLRLACDYGVTQRAVAADPAHNELGAYARNAFMLKVGWDLDNGDGKNYVDLNMGSLIEDTSSLFDAQKPQRRMLQYKPDSSHALVPFDSLVPRAPEKGYAVSVNSRWTIGDHWAMGAEGACSLLSTIDSTLASDSVTKKLLPNLSNLPRGGVVNEVTYWLARQVLPLMRDGSPRVDVAGRFHVNATYDPVSVAASVNYFGAGYTPLGYTFSQSDRIECSVVPRFSLFDNRLIATTSVGFRFYNPWNTTLGQAAFPVWNSYADVILLPSDNVTIGLNYGIDGSRNDGFSGSWTDPSTGRDTTVQRTALQTISHSFTCSPSVNFTTGGTAHGISASATVGSFATIDSARHEHSTVAAMLNYTCGFAGVPFTLNFGASVFSDNDSAAGLTIAGFSAGGTYRLFDNALRPGLSIGWTQTRFVAATPDHHLTMRFSLNYSLTKRVTLNMNGTINSRQYGSSKHDATATESFLRSSLNWRF